MRKEVIAVVLVVLALTLTACQSGGDKSQSSGSSTPFIGGTTGLTAKFATNSPPAEVTDRDPQDKSGTNTFDIILLLENVGEAKVEKGKASVTVSGISASDFSSNLKSLAKTTGDDLSEVKKDTEGNKIPGAVTDVRFENLGFQSSLQGNAVFPVQADVCYPYQTRAVTDLCIRADATKTASGVCQIAGQKQVFNSGAPVQVISAKENVGGRNKVLLTFNVKTVGAGAIFKPDTKAGCPRGTFSAENQAKVEVNTGVGPKGDITCSGLSGGEQGIGSYSGFLRLDNGAGTFSCIQKTPSEDSVKKVNVYLTYNHLITASTSLLVKHLPTDDSSTGSSPSSSSATSASAPPAAPGAPSPPAAPGTTSSQPKTQVSNNNAAVLKYVDTSGTTISTGYTTLKTVCDSKKGYTFNDAEAAYGIEGQCTCPSGQKWSDSSDVSKGCA